MVTGTPFVNCRWWAVGIQQAGECIREDTIHPWIHMHESLWAAIQGPPRTQEPASAAVVASACKQSCHNSQFPCVASSSCNNSQLPCVASSVDKSIKEGHCNEVPVCQ